MRSTRTGARWSAGVSQAIWNVKGTGDTPALHWRTAGMTTTCLGDTAVVRWGAVALHVLRIGQPRALMGQCMGAACSGGAQQICATTSASPATTPHVRADIAHENRPVAPLAA